MNTEHYYNIVVRLKDNADSTLSILLIAPCVCPRQQRLMIQIALLSARGGPEVYLSFSSSFKRSVWCKLSSHRILQIYSNSLILM